MLNVRVTYASPKKNWEISAYMINVTDAENAKNEVEDDPPPNGLGSSIASDFTDGSPTYSREDPRLQGIEFKYLF